VIEEKGIETAINALSHLPPDTTLEIVGPIEQAYRQRLEALAATLGVASQLSFFHAFARTIDREASCSCFYRVLIF